MPKSSIINPATGDFFDTEDAMWAAHYDVVNRYYQDDQWQYANTDPASITDSLTTRIKLVSAARFTVANNSYCSGIVRKMSQEVVGTGPRLEIMPDAPSARAARAAKRLEQIWEEWSEETTFVENLCMAVSEEIIAGEIFVKFRSNRQLESPAKLDFVTYEGLQVTSAAYWGDMYEPDWDLRRVVPAIDGIRLDDAGNVLGYYIAKHHPGTGEALLASDVDYIPADNIVHLFRKERPTQYRGVPHVTPCIELFEKLRRYTEATIGTAEAAAALVGTIETAFQPDLCSSPIGADGKQRARNIRVGTGQMTMLPAGWKMNPFKPEQPTTAYGAFKQEILHEIISCLLIPWNIASSDSSEFNFASGQLDHRIFERYVKFQRQRLEQRLMNRFFRFWMGIATFLPGVVPTGLGAFKHKWYWPSKDPIDPTKAANAAKLLKEAGLLDEHAYWQERGLPAEEAITRQLQLEAYRAKEIVRIEEEMGVSLGGDQMAKEQQYREEVDQGAFDG